MGEGDEGGGDNDNVKDEAKVSTKVGRSKEMEFVVVLKEEEEVQGKEADVHDNSGVGPGTEVVAEGGVSIGRNTVRDNLGEADCGCPLQEEYIFEEELLPKANVGTSSIVGERGGESGTRHVTKEGTNTETSCHSPGDVVSTYEVDSRTRGVEEARENVDVEQVSMDEVVEAANSTCDEEEVQAATGAIATSTRLVHTSKDGGAWFIAA